MEGLGGQRADGNGHLPKFFLLITYAPAQLVVNPTKASGCASTSMYQQYLSTRTMASASGHPLVIV